MANLLMRRRVEHEITVRRDLPDNHPMYVSNDRLRGLAKGFESRLTSVQRVENRYGGPKVSQKIATLLPGNVVKHIKE